MDITLFVISFSQTGLLLVTFLMGFLAYKLTLPPMLGFLAIGFIFNYFGLQSTQEVREIADLGVTLMLFTIGLKLDLKSLLRVQIWGVASSHMIITIVVYMLLFLGLSAMGTPGFHNVSLLQAFVVAFALSFSSTVFAIKFIEGKGDTAALYAKIAVGILIVQDIFAVIFLTVSTGKIPSAWALLLLGLPFIRPVLYKIMDDVEHGELLVLYSLLLAVGGAALFEMVGMKADLGALIFGLLLAGHEKSTEVSNILYTFKDLFLVAFFINIGLSASLTIESFYIALILVVFMFLKVVLYFWLLLKTRLRARTSFLTSLSLANYSEFGLIVGAIAVSNQLIPVEWLTAIAIALAITFILSSPVNQNAYELYIRGASFYRQFQSKHRLLDEKPVDTANARILILGMGRMGTNVYDDLASDHQGKILGIDFDNQRAIQHQQEGRHVVYGDVMDEDMWNRLDLSNIETIYINLPDFSKNLFSLQQIRKKDFHGKVAVIASYQEDMEPLKAAGADYIYNFYSEAGIGFCEYVKNELKQADMAAKSKEEIAATDAKEQPPGNNNAAPRKTDNHQENHNESSEENKKTT